MTPGVAGRLSLDDTARSVLALAEPLNITNFQAQVAAAGIRRETRAYDGKALRARLDDWGRRGLVHSDERAFTCARDLRWQVLRAAAARGRLDELAATLGQSLYGAVSSAYYIRVRGSSS